MTQTPTARPPRDRGWVAAAWLSAPAAVGALVIWAAGAGPSRWEAQALLCVAGLASVWWVRRARWSKQATARGAWQWAPWVGVGVVGLSLAFEGVDGVRRWVAHGPIRLHPSALLAPSLVVLIARRRSQHPADASRGVVALLALQCIHALQPDAGQATAGGAASAVALLRSHAPSRWRVAGAALSIGLAALTWLRPDPLEAAPFVEDILVGCQGSSPRKPLTPLA